MSALAPTNADLHAAQTLLGTHPHLLATGATCWVFAAGSRVLRLARPHPAGAARFLADAQIRRLLAAAGVPTPQVLEVGEWPDGRSYSLDALVLGDGAAPTADGWADLGRALKVLHALPHSGYGLLEDRADQLKGEAATPAQGIHTRLSRVWPWTGQPLAAHPLIWAAPDLRGPLERQQDDLLSAVTRPTAVCHTDLHHNQFQWQRGRLLAVMDFGDASAFPPAWDYASLAYFHGWDVAAQVAQVAEQPWSRDIPLLGLLLSFHRAARAAEGHPQQGAQAVAFARQCLARLNALR